MLAALINHHKWQMANLILPIGTMSPYQNYNYTTTIITVAISIWINVSCHLKIKLAGFFEVFEILQIL